MAEFLIKQPKIQQRRKKMAGNCKQANLDSKTGHFKKNSPPANETIKNSIGYLQKI